MVSIMTFNNFLQLIDNINQDFYFYVRVNEKDLPLSKITVSSNDFLAYPGKHAVTKRKIVKLFKNMHNRGLSLYIFYHNQRIPVYGIQISIENISVTLM